VTVVTPSFHQAKYLEATIRSVLSQEGVRLDYIVRDGGSTDGSVEILGQYASRFKSWKSEGDRGQADAVGRGFEAAECGPEDVMAFLNSDDLLMPGAVRFVAGYFARHPEADVVFGHRVLVDEAGREVGRWFTPRLSCFDLRIHDFVPQETLFWRKRIWDKVGGIDGRFQFSADWDLLLRFAEAGARFRRLPWFLGLFRRHPAQKTATQATETGLRERDALRLRSLGRTPKASEVDADMRRAQVESAFLASLFRRGWRL
jgi:glycosyltransferase involved in cell wall biosynthesis